MSTTAWPPLPAHELQRAEEDTLARELRWLLAALQDTFASLRAGLDECHALLAPAAPGATLVVSSPRSEAVKGVVARVGARIVKADVQLRLPTLPPPPRAAAFPLRLAAAASAASPSADGAAPPADAPVFAIPQLAAVRNRVAQALDVVDAATYTGDAQSAPFVAGQLRLLLDLVREARAILKGEVGAEEPPGGGGGTVGAGGDGDGSGPWWENPMDENTFDPPLPPTFAVHLSLSDASLVFTFRTLQIVTGSSPSPLPPDHATPPHGPSTLGGGGGGGGGGSGGGSSSNPFSGDALVSLRQRLGLAARLPEHDESGRRFAFRGQGVRVREKVRVETPDPGLMSVMAKLGALEYGVRAARANLAVLTGEEADA